MHWSDCANVQAYLRHCCSHTTKSGFPWSMTERVTNDLMRLTGACAIRAFTGRICHNYPKLTSCADPEWGQGVRAHPSLKNHTNIGFLSKTGLDPLKITKLPSQHSMLDHLRHASETPSNGVSLAGRWLPVYSRIWILLSPHQLKNIKQNVVNAGPPLT